MLLAIDIGNSNISVGLFDKAGKLLFLSSIDTDSRKTADQISIDLMNLFALYRYDLKDVTGAIFSSVVPPINFMMTKALTRLLGEPPMVVGPGVKTGLNIRMEVHNQLGADLVANAVAALEKYAPPIIMIDMGTATTISYISAKRSYEGGLMFPGVRLSSGCAVRPHGPTAGYLLAASQTVDWEKYRGLYALRHRLRHGGNAGRHYRPHQGDVAG